jgi:hypothetical protein
MVLPASDPGYDPPVQKEIIAHIPVVGERRSALRVSPRMSGGDTTKREGGERRSGPSNAFGVMRLPASHTVCDESPPRMRSSVALWALGSRPIATGVAAEDLGADQ